MSPVHTIKCYSGTRQQIDSLFPEVAGHLSALLSGLWFFVSCWGLMGLSPSRLTCSSLPSYSSVIWGTCWWDFTGVAPEVTRRQSSCKFPDPPALVVFSPALMEYSLSLRCNILMSNRHRCSSYGQKNHPDARKGEKP